MKIIKSKLLNHVTAKALLSVITLSVLVACGSGSSTATDTSVATSPSTTPTPVTTTGGATLVDTFIGHFRSNCETDGNKSTITFAQFSKVTESQFAGATEADIYSDSACTYYLRTESLTNMKMTIVGNKTVGGILVRKIMGTATEGVGKFIMFSSGELVGNYIQMGVSDPKDSEGFPEQLEVYKMYRYTPVSPVTGGSGPGIIAGVRG